MTTSGLMAHKGPVNICPRTDGARKVSTHALSRPPTPLPLLSLSVSPSLTKDDQDHSVTEVSELFVLFHGTATMCVCVCVCARARACACVCHRACACACGQACRLRSTGLQKGGKLCVRAHLESTSRKKKSTPREYEQEKRDPADFDLGPKLQVQTDEECHGAVMVACSGEWG